MTNFPGVFVPREIILNNELSSTDKLVYAVVQSLDNERGCYASNHYIGEVAGVGAETVRASIAKMEQMGLIIRYFIQGAKPNDIERTIKTASTVALTPPKEVWGAPQENLVPPPEKSGVYNTRDNTKDKYKGMPVDIMLPHGEKFKEAWGRWVDYRKERKKPLTKMTIDMQLKECEANTEPESINAINKSIQRGWLGLFFEKSARPIRNPLTSEDHNAF